MHKFQTHKLTWLTTTLFLTLAASAAVRPPEPRQIDPLDTNWRFT